MPRPAADEFREKLHQWFAEEAAKGKEHIRDQRRSAPHESW